MKKFTVLTLLAILLCLCFSASVHAVSDPFWIYGTVTTTPKVSTYNNLTYSEFNFSVSSSNASWLGAPVNLTVAIPTSLLVGIGLVVNQTLNMTGVVDVVGVPSGYFVCEEVTQTGSWQAFMYSLKSLIGAVGLIGKLVVTVIVQLIGAAFGVVVPSWVVALAVLVVTVASFMVWFEKLPKLLAIVFLFLIVSLIVSLAL
ncbi:hypothetical protein MUP01_10790 [Candidatus Bathyarchaeota archaeon]|nr:hypothetical protein [Candidatus Bathyarchaeota archaeon]